MTIGIKPTVVQLEQTVVTKSTPRHTCALTRTLLTCAAITIAYRVIAVFAWYGVPVGINAAGKSTPLMFCLARLFEFAFGIWLAQQGRTWWERPSKKQLVTAIAVGAVIWCCGIATACYHTGFVLCDAVIGAGLPLMLFGLIYPMQHVRPVQRSLVFLGKQSYALFLMHSLLIPTMLSFAPGRPYAVGLIIYCGAACVLAMGLNYAVYAMQSILPQYRHWRSQQVTA